MIKKSGLVTLKMECVDKISQIKNEYIKICFKRFGFKKGIEFHSMAEIQVSQDLDHRVVF